LFRRGDYRKRGNDPEKLSWVRFPVKMFSVARKLSTIEERLQVYNFCFGEEITGTKATTPPPPVTPTGKTTNVIKKFCVEFSSLERKVWVSLEDEEGM
jgi:hypothetical protein